MRSEPASNSINVDRNSEVHSRTPAQGADALTTLRSFVRWAQDQTLFDGRHGISFRDDRRGKLFAPIFERHESFLRDGHGVTTLDKSASPDLPGFLESCRKEPLAYGYPVHVDATGLVTPVFFVEVTASSTADAVTVRKMPGRRPRLSHRVLIEAGYDPKRVEVAREALEHGSYASFDACLTDLAGYLGIDPLAITGADLMDLPPPPIAPGWYRTPVLFQCLASEAQTALLTELDRLPRAFGQATYLTALHALVQRRDGPVDRGPAVLPDRPPTVEVEPLSEDAARALELCLTSPLSVITAPPGGEKEAFVAAVIANLVTAGQSVLYVHPNREMTDEVVDRFQAILTRRQCWIPRLGGADMLERLSRSADELEAQRPTGIAPPAKQARQRGLADPKGDLAMARGRIAACRGAIRAFVEHREQRANRVGEIAQSWEPAIAHADLLAIEADQAAEAAMELRSLTGDRPGFLGRLFGRKEGHARLTALATQLSHAVAPLPQDARERLPLPSDVSALAEPADAVPTIDAFVQLERIARWRDDIRREARLLEDVLRLTPAPRVAEQIMQAELRLARDSQGLLRDVWRAAIAKGAGKSAEKLAAVFQAITDRQYGAEATDPAVDQQLAKFLRLLVRNYPMWAVAADLVPSHLPLTDGLFDMAILDDADTLTAAALLPLLLRVRQAVVLGPAEQQGALRNTGFSVAALAERASVVTLGAQLRQHPDIVRYLSAVFHGGSLTLQGRVVQPSDAPGLGLTGLHWHDADGGGPMVESATILALLRDWHDAGLFAGPAPLTIGVAVPVAGRLMALEQFVMTKLPDPGIGETLVFGPPEQFKDLELDVMVLVPGLDSGMAAPAAAALASNGDLFHDAAAAAERGIHIIGDAATCRLAGGFAVALLERCHRHQTGPAPTTQPDADSGARYQALARLCDQAGLTWRPAGDSLHIFGRMGGLYRIAWGPRGRGDDRPVQKSPDLHQEVFTVHLNDDEMATPPHWLGAFLERLC